MTLVSNYKLKLLLHVGSETFTELIYFKILVVRFMGFMAVWSVLSDTKARPASAFEIILEKYFSAVFEFSGMNSSI